MASYDQLASGLHRATVVLPVKLPNGRNKRVTKTHRLKGVVEEWAKKLEGRIAAGNWNDPRDSATTLAEYRERWRRDKIADGSTLKKVDSHWSVHLEETWGGYPIGLIARPELKAWVKRLATEQCRRCHGYPGTQDEDEGPALVTHRVKLDGKAAERARKRGEPLTRVCSGSGETPGLGAWTIQGIVSHLSGLLTSAVEDGLIPANPGLKLGLPPTRPKPVFYWTRSEAAAILLALGGANALAVELDLYVGLRPGELFGLRKQYIDTDQWQIHVHGVATRDGWRPWAKTSKSHRSTPVPTSLRPRLAAHLAELGHDDLVFPAPSGGTWDDRNFSERVFTPAIEAAGVKRGTPYDMRHTAASWLVQAGVDLQRVQELLGHEKYATTLRYAHLRPKAFGEVLDAWGDAQLDPRAGALEEAPSSPDPHGP